MDRMDPITAPDTGLRLDHWLCQHYGGLSHGAAGRFIEAGHVRINGRVARKGTLLAEGDRVQVQGSPMDTIQPDPVLPLSVLYEDPHVAVVDKPAGVHSHPLGPHETGTLAGALLHRYPEMGALGHDPLQPGLVHRLDRDTSGCLIAARDGQTFDRLRDQLLAGRIDKHYTAVCAGPGLLPGPLLSQLRAEGPRVQVKDNPFSRSRQVTLEVLSVRPLEHSTLGAVSLVEVRAHVAARHQVRAQLAHAGHPIVGDGTYGGPLLAGLDRHLLHARRVAFEGVDGLEVVVESRLPAEMVAGFTGT